MCSTAQEYKLAEHLFCADCDMGSGKCGTITDRSGMPANAGELWQPPGIEKYRFATGGCYGVAVDQTSVAANLDLYLAERPATEDWGARVAADRHSKQRCESFSICDLREHRSDAMLLPRDRSSGTTWPATIGHLCG